MSLISGKRVVRKLERKEQDVIIEGVMAKVLYKKKVDCATKPDIIEGVRKNPYIKFSDEQIYASLKRLEKAGRIESHIGDPEVDLTAYNFPFNKANK